MSYDVTEVSGKSLISDAMRQTPPGQRKVFQSSVQPCETFLQFSDLGFFFGGGGGGGGCFWTN